MWSNPLLCFCPTKLRAMRKGCAFPGSSAKGCGESVFVPVCALHQVYGSRTPLHKPGQKYSQVAVSNARACLGLRVPSFCYWRHGGKLGESYNALLKEETWYTYGHHENLCPKLYCHRKPFLACLFAFLPFRVKHVYVPAHACQGWAVQGMALGQKPVVLYFSRWYCQPQQAMVLE